MTLGTANSPSPKMSGEPFSVPTHVAIDKRTGEFYVGDGYSNARVHKYSPDGKLLFSWGESGTSEGQFNIVHNLVVDKDGWVYVADRENHRVQVFDSKGRYETQWVNLSRAATICIDDSSGEELFYVGEYFAGIKTNDTGTDLGPRVTILNKKGQNPRQGRSGVLRRSSRPILLAPRYRGGLARKHLRGRSFLERLRQQVGSPA